VNAADADASPLQTPFGNVETSLAFRHQTLYDEALIFRHSSSELSMPQTSKPNLRPPLTRRLVRKEKQ